MLHRRVALSLFCDSGPLVGAVSLLPSLKWVVLLPRDGSDTTVYSIPADEYEALQRSQSLHPITQQPIHLYDSQLDECTTRWACLTALSLTQGLACQRPQPADFHPPHSQAQSTPWHYHKHRDLLAHYEDPPPYASPTEEVECLVTLNAMCQTEVPQIYRGFIKHEGWAQENDPCFIRNDPLDGIQSFKDLSPQRLQIIQDDMNAGRVSEVQRIITHLPFLALLPLLNWMKKHIPSPSMNAIVPRIATRLLDTCHEWLTQKKPGDWSKVYNILYAIREANPLDSHETWRQILSVTRQWPKQTIDFLKSQQLVMARTLSACNLIETIEWSQSLWIEKKPIEPLLSHRIADQIIDMVASQELAIQSIEPYFFLHILLHASPKATEWGRVACQVSLPSLKEMGRSDEIGHPFKTILLTEWLTHSQDRLAHLCQDQATRKQLFLFLLHMGTIHHVHLGHASLSEDTIQHYFNAFCTVIRHMVLSKELNPMGIHGYLFVQTGLIMAAGNQIHPASIGMARSTHSFWIGQICQEWGYALDVLRWYGNTYNHEQKEDWISALIHQVDTIFNQNTGATLILPTLEFLKEMVATLNDLNARHESDSPYQLERLTQHIARMTHTMEMAYC